MKKSKAKSAAVFGIMIALAFTLSYLESLLPLNIGIPGVKLGLANLVVVIALYRLKTHEALFIALIRILLAGLTFGNTYSLIYSLCGGLLSFAAMALAKKTKLSIIGTSILGGTLHNVGQLAAAAVLMGTARIAYYLPVLLVAGLLTGFLNGILAKIITDRIKRTDD